MKKKWLLVITVLLILGYLGYSYLYQGHRDIQSEQAEFVVSSKSISKEFSENITIAEQKYLNKTIEIQGSITEINTTDVTLDKVIFCTFDKAINNNIQLNSNIKIKGRLIGYDDLLEQIKLDQTTIIN